MGIRKISQVKIIAKKPGSTSSISKEKTSQEASIEMSRILLKRVQRTFLAAPNSGVVKREVELHDGELELLRQRCLDYQKRHNLEASKLIVLNSENVVAAQLLVTPFSVGLNITRKHTPTATVEFSDEGFMTLRHGTRYAQDNQELFNYIYVLLKDILLEK